VGHLVTIAPERDAPADALLDARDERAWDAYARACHQPSATDEQRAVLFQAAMVTTTAVLTRDRIAPQAMVTRRA
jgi:hypothetical protein